MTEITDLLQQQMNDPLTILFITLGSFYLGEQFFIKSGRKGWLHPLFTSSFAIFLLIRYTPLAADAFQEHNQILKTLLAPFTVALAVPLSKQLNHLRQLLGPLVISLVAGGILAVAIGMGLAIVSGATDDVVLSISTKAVTTAVALVVGEEFAAILPLVAAVVILCGVYGGIIGPGLCRRFGITDPRVVGFAMGVNAHAGGTARAFELDVTMGVYASLGMCLSAIYMPVLLPMMISLFI